MKKIQNVCSVVAVLLAVFSCNKGIGDEGSHAKASETAAVAAPSVASAGSTEGLVSVNGQVLNENDVVTGLKGRGKGQYFKAKAEFFEAQQGAVNDYLFDYLVGLEAKKTGKTPEEIVKKEVEEKIKKVADRDIQKFYDNFKEQAQKMNRPIPPLSDEIKGRIRQQLESEKQEERRTVYFDQLKKTYKVAYLMSPPRMEVAVGDLPVRGSTSAPVTIVTFSDFECPYCQRGAQTAEKVLKEYKGRVKLYFRDYPLGFHPKAKPAAVAARCAGDQGKFWQYHDALFNSQKEWLGKAKDDAAMNAEFLAIAKKVGAKEDAFKKCVEGGEKMAKVDSDQKAGEDVGVTGTPAFFINGIPLSGALPFEKFKEVIDQELVRSRSKTAQTAMP